MRINHQFIDRCWETWLLALFMGIFSVVAVKAEENFNFDMLNGLFTPTQSERFFQKGREDFEREVNLFTHSEKHFSDDLLQIDPKLIEQMNLQRQVPQFESNNSQHRIYRDELK